MFLSYEYIKDLGYDEKTKQYRYQYKIIDTDFEEADARCRAHAFGNDELAAEVAVVETYRKRNLPVVPNLILCWQSLYKKYGYTIEQQIVWFRKYSPYFPEYEDEINKYLLLL